MIVALVVAAAAVVSTFVAFCCLIVGSRFDDLIDDLER